LRPFTIKLEHADRTPADPPTIESTVTNWRTADTIPLGRDRSLRVVGIVVSAEDEPRDPPRRRDSPLRTRRLLETLREDDHPASVAHPLLPKRDCHWAFEIRTGADEARALFSRPCLHGLDELRREPLALESIRRAECFHMYSAIGAVGEHFPCRAVIRIG
jgi:hypothetical protein